MRWTPSTRTNKRNPNSSHVCWATTIKLVATPYDLERTVEGREGSQTKNLQLKNSPDIASTSGFIRLPFQY